MRERARGRGPPHAPARLRQEGRPPPAPAPDAAPRDRTSAWPSAGTSSRSATRRPARRWKACGSATSTIELLRAGRGGRLRASRAAARSGRVNPGEEIVARGAGARGRERVVRLAARALAGGEASPRSPTVALIVQPPPAVPRDLTATLVPDGVALAWKGTRPPPIPRPVPSPSPSPVRVDAARTAAAGGEPVAFVLTSTFSVDDAVAGGPPPPGARPSPSPSASPSPSPSPTPPPFPERLLRLSARRGRRLRARPSRRRVGDNRSPTRRPPWAGAGATWCGRWSSLDPLVESGPPSEACADRKDVFAPSPPPASPRSSATTGSS